MSQRLLSLSQLGLWHWLLLLTTSVVFVNVENAYFRTRSFPYNHSITDMLWPGLNFILRKQRYLIKIDNSQVFQVSMIPSKASKLTVSALPCAGFSCFM